MREILVYTVQYTYIYYVLIYMLSYKLGTNTMIYIVLYTYVYIINIFKRYVLIIAIRISFPIFEFYETF